MGPDDADQQKKCRTHWEPIGAGVRAPLSGDGGTRQGRRVRGVGGRSLVVVEATRRLEAAIMEVWEFR